MSVGVLPIVVPVIQKLVNVAMPDESVTAVRVPPRVPTEVESSVTVTPGFAHGTNEALVI